MCGIVGYVGERSCRELLLHGLERLEYRGYDSAGLSLLGDGRIESVRAVGNLSRLREAVDASGVERRRHRGRDRDRRGHHRHRPHALGHARQALRAQRAPARGLHRPRPHRPQRDHRELRRAARAARGRGPPLRLRDDAEAVAHLIEQHLERSARPAEADAPRLPRAARPLRVRRDVRGRAGHDRRRAQGVPAGGRASARASTSSPPRSPRSCATPATCSSSSDDEIVDDPPRGAQFRSAAGQPVEREIERDHVGRGCGREGRLSDLHAEGDPRAVRCGRGDDRRSPRARRPRRSRRHRHRRRRPRRACAGS